MKEKFILENIKADYILYVPLHKKRLKKRGFNQSERIASRLSEVLDIPVLDSIERVKNTKRLYNLNKKEREQEVKNSFIIKDKNNLLKDKNVILIDDIFTTASTTNEISKLLRLIPVNKITILTLLTRARDTYISDKENEVKINELQAELDNEQNRAVTSDMFLSSVRKYTRARKLTPRMLNELIDKIEVYQAEKIDGKKVQRLKIHYNCIGAIEIPDLSKLPENNVSVHTRQGVNVQYAALAV